MRWLTVFMHLLSVPAMAQEYAVQDSAFAEQAYSQGGYAANEECGKDDTPFSIAMPVYNGLYGSPYMFGGYYGGAYDLWHLHQGFNVQLSAGVTVASGRHTPKGAGFGQSISLAYAGKLNRNFSYAVILQGMHSTWGPVRNVGASVSGIVAYQPSDRFTLYAYFTKSLMNHPSRRMMPYPFYDEPAIDRIGAMADIKLGETSNLRIAVEMARMKNAYFDGDYYAGYNPYEPSRNYGFGLHRSMLPFGGYTIPY